MDEKKPIDPEQVQKGVFSKVITLCESKINLLKGKPDRAKKYEKLKDVYQSAQSKLRKCIEKTKEIKLANPTDPDKPSFYDEYIKGKDEFVSLSWLSSKLNAVKNNGELAEGEGVKVATLDMKTKTVDVRYDFVDATKNVMNQITKGTGISNKITKGCLFVCLGELLSHGVTAALAQQGIMQGSMGLIGLGKLGLAQLPKLLPIIKTGAAMFMGLPQLALAAGGAFALFKGIPMVKGYIDKVKKNHKNAQAFDKGMKDILNQQQQNALA